MHALILPGHKARYAVFAAILAFLSLDDMILIHERVASELKRPLFEHVEIVIFLPVFAVAFLIVWAVAREVSARAGRLLRFGMLLLVVAVLVDVGKRLTTDFEEEGTAWPQTLRVVIEEALEFSGWILVSATLTSVLCLALLNAGRSSEKARIPR